MPLDPSRDAVPAPCKGVPPLTLFRDWIERTFMLCTRVYAGISLLRERNPRFTKALFRRKAIPLLSRLRKGIPQPNRAVEHRQRIG